MKFWWRKSKANPTLDWRPKDVPVSIDLDALTICSVRLGEPIDGLRDLGPATQQLSDHWIWPRLGLGIRSTEAGMIASFWVIYRRSRDLRRSRRELTPYHGAVMLKKGFIDIGPDTTEAEFVDLMGQPFWRHEEDEVGLFYEFGRTELVANLDWQDMHRATLSNLIVQTPPVLSDPHHRKWYGIDKALPNA